MQQKGIKEKAEVHYAPSQKQDSGRVELSFILTFVLPELTREQRCKFYMGI